MNRKDYRIEVKVRNNWLLKKIEDAGYDSVNQFSVKNKLPPSRVGEFVNLKETPINHNGKWRYHFVKIANALKCMPEDICPPQHLKEALKKNKATFEANVEEVAGYLTGASDDAIPAIEHMLYDEAMSDLSECMTYLTPREERILRMRFGLDGGEEKTLKEVAEVFSLSRDRIRQIEAVALRKLKYVHSHGYDNRVSPEAKKKIKGLRQSAESIGIHGWYENKPVNRHYVPEWKKTGEKE